MVVWYYTASIYVYFVLYLRGVVAIIFQIMKKEEYLSRRDMLKYIGIIGASFTIPFVSNHILQRVFSYGEFASYDEERNEKIWRASAVKIHSPFGTGGGYLAYTDNSHSGLAVYSINHVIGEDEYQMAHPYQEIDIEVPGTFEGDKSVTFATTINAFAKQHSIEGFDALIYTVLPDTYRAAYQKNVMCTITPHV